MNEDCSEIRKDLDCYVDNELEPERLKSIESHFKNCLPCVRLYNLIVAVKNKLRHVGTKTDVPHGLKSKILKAIEQEASPVRSPWSWQVWRSWFPAPALAAAAIVFMFVVFSRPNDTSAHNFTDISMMAYERVVNNEMNLSSLDGEKYAQKLLESELPGNTLPSLSDIGYECQGCCFGLKVNKPSGHYLFKDSDGKELSVLMWKRSCSEDKMDGKFIDFDGKNYYVTNRHGLEMVQWEDNNVFCSVFGSQDQQHLLEVASILRR